MVPVASLWLPIVLSAVIVFLASWIVHMFLPFHRSDFAKLPQEDAVLDALRSLNVPSGQYLAPFANTPAQMKQPEYMEKRKRGPAVFLTLATGADLGMGKSLMQWFVYLLVISLFAAYLAHKAIATGAPRRAGTRGTPPPSRRARSGGCARASGSPRRASARRARSI